MLSTAEIEREFNLEIREKKRTANGIHSRTGKRGYTGVVRFPSNLLRGKEKREYTKPGKVRGYNMFSTLMTNMELKTHPEDRQKEILTKWRETYKAKEIQEALGMDHNGYYELLYRLGVLERPASANGKTSSQKKRNKPDAPGDIISFVDLKLMPIEQQLQKYDELQEKYNVASIGEVWGRDLSKLYSYRYTLAKRVEKAKQKGEIVDKTVDKPKQQVLRIESYDGAPEIDKLNNFDQDDVEIEEIERIEQENKMPETEQIIKEAIQEKDELTGMNREELEDLKKLVFAQSHLLTQLVESQKEQVHLAAVTPAPKPEPKKAAMQFNFEDEKEGFILHSDLERFISVLKKNPDQFKVEVKITRIED